jgi:hypothetical protein
MKNESRVPRALFSKRAVTLALATAAASVMLIPAAQSASAGTLQVTGAAVQMTLLGEKPILGCKRRCGHRHYHHCHHHHCGHRHKHRHHKHGHKHGRDGVHHIHVPIGDDHKDDKDDRDDTPVRPVEPVKDPKDYEDEKDYGDYEGYEDEGYKGHKGHKDHKGHKGDKHPWWAGDDHDRLPWWADGADGRDWR